jgi:hypothetical protein
MTWQIFEKKVREIAQFRWDCDAVTETIAGVKCDCVLKPSAEEWILIEITKERNLKKVRTDVAKLAGIRSAQLQKYIVCRCYIILEDRPTDSMKACGGESNIRVVSLEEFQNDFFNYSNYVYIRKQKQFGSLVDLLTGEPEENKYVNVTYQESDSGTNYSINQLAELLREGKRIVLKGDYGLGKSRCIKQLFDQISSDTANYPYVFAINLRDQWGMKRGIEILRRHFEDLGMDGKNFIKSFDRPNSIYLLDGFDEIGSQSWSSDMRIMELYRANAVQAVKDLIWKVRGGILISGRGQYFNSDEEMCRSLGLSKADTIILECRPEFLENEILEYIHRNISEDVSADKLALLPEWLPRRPFVMRLLLNYAGEIFSDEQALSDRYRFWSAFLKNICEREANIDSSLNPEIIKNVMIALAHKTRTTRSNMGPISINEIENTFRDVAGYTPTNESITMLLRLPTLTRVSANTPDRQFSDTYILNGLRAEHIIQLAESKDLKVPDTEWLHPLEEPGVSILVSFLEQKPGMISTYVDLLGKANESGNTILAGDLLEVFWKLGMVEKTT